MLRLKPKRVVARVADFIAEIDGVRAAVDDEAQLGQRHVGRDVSREFGFDRLPGAFNRMCCF